MLEKPAEYAGELSRNGTPTARWARKATGPTTCRGTEGDLGRCKAVDHGDPPDVLIAMIDRWWGSGAAEGERMKGRPQMCMTPSPGVFFVSPSSSAQGNILSDPPTNFGGESKDPVIRVLEALARLFGLRLPQLVPVRVRR